MTYPCEGCGKLLHERFGSSGRQKNTCSGRCRARVHRRRKAAAEGREIKKYTRTIIVDGISTDVPIDRPLY